MTFPVEIVATGLALFGTAITIAVGFCASQIMAINVRLARMEERLGIENKKPTR